MSYDIFNEKEVEMPSSTKRQSRFMRAVAHSPEFAKKVDVPQSVGKEFEKADEAKTGKKSAKTMIEQRYGRE